MFDRLCLLASLPLLLLCGCLTSISDADGDGFPDYEDCAPTDPDSNPSAEDPWGDGVDSDCDGGDGLDRDRDGFPANLEDGDPFQDCDDNNPLVNPDAFDLVSDGADTNCDGHAGIDGDGDQHASIPSGGADCDDAEAAIHPNGLDPYGDAVDQDCDGGDGVDADGDGYAVEDPDYAGPPVAWDCNDTNALIHPGALDFVTDGVDGNCDGHAGMDADGDGDASIPSGGLDCDDGDAAIGPGANDPFGDEIDQDCSGSDGRDFDGDGYPDDDPAYEGPPVAFDCNDGNPLIHPGAVEIVSDGIDNDCDGLDAADLDQDGHVSDLGGGDDCNDADANTYPGAPEQADGLDNDCDGTVDEGTILHDDDGDGYSEVAGDCDDANALLTPADADGDGYSLCTGDCDDSDPGATPADADLDGVSGCLGDCDDFNPLVNPTVAEVCNGADDNCDGLLVGEQDTDGDGAPACNDCDDADPSVESLDSDGDGFSTCQGDCNDGLALANPFAPDAIGDGLDQNCDGADGIDIDGDGAASALSGGTDCDDTDPLANQLDVDGDGESTCDGDCDDVDPTRHPSAPETCGDGVDSDCGGDLEAEVDDDGDGYAECAGDCDDGDPSLHPDDGDGDGASPCAGDCDDSDVTLNALDADTDGYSTCAADCDDLDPDRNPAASELCNLVDDNCDGVLLAAEADGDGDGDPLCTDCDDGDGDATTLDVDGDGFDTCTGNDCDDESIAWNPVAIDGFGDALDTNCDGVDGLDVDGDGFASSLTGGPDCDDSDPAVSPIGLEVALDGIDQDCDGLDAADDDGDGYASVITGGDDCNDNDASVYPGFFEDWGDSLDDNCDGSDGNTFFSYSGPYDSSYGDDFLAAFSRQAVAWCDLNGDGFNDLAVGSPLAPADPASPWSHDGLVAVWYGPVTGGGSMAGAPARFRGLPNAHLGQAVVCMGDTDGDGQEELAIAAPTGAASNNPSAAIFYSDYGAVFLVQGSHAGAVLLDHGVAQPDVVRLVASSTPSGASVAALATAADLDGDGALDLILGEGYGSTASYWPPDFGLNGDRTMYVVSAPFVDGGDPVLDAVATISFPGSYGPVVARFAAPAGDTNGDGYGDLLVLDPGYTDPSSGTLEGGVFLFLGPLVGGLTRDSAQARIATFGDGDYLEAGFDADGVGDLNNDGFDDIAVTLPWATGPTSAQTPIPQGTHIYFGPINGTVELAFADSVVAVPDDYASLMTVAGAGDLNLDGLDDLIVSASSWYPSGGFEVAAVSRAVYGPFGGSIDWMGPATEALGEPASPQSYMHAASVGAADLDGDGVPDPVVLAWDAYGANAVRVFPNPHDP